MFANCTSLTTAPTLYGAILAPYCYRNMFDGCTSLNHIKYYGNLSSYTNGNDQFSNWVNNVASSGIFENPNNINFPRNENGVPASWSLINPWAGLTIECTKGPLQLDWGMTTYVVDGAKTIQYSTDNINWTSISSYNDNASYSDGTSLHGRFPILNTGDKLYIKGNNSWYNYHYYNDYHSYSTLSKIIQPNQVLSNNELISNDGEFNIYGNIMSLINSTNFSNLTALPNNPDDDEFTFNRLFANTNVVNASGLMLPATTLMPGCYYNMFEGCTLLTAAPELPATSLTPACYYGMFKGCTSLTNAPELPATTLAADCYHDMFYGCTSLNYVKYSGTAEWTIFNGEFDNWLYNVAYNGTFVNPNNIDFPRNDNGIPASWSIYSELQYKNLTNYNNSRVARLSIQNEEENSTNSNNSEPYDENIHTYLISSNDNEHAYILIPSEWENHLDIYIDDEEISRGHIFNIDDIIQLRKDILIDECRYNFYKTFFTCKEITYKMSSL